ncbi:MAG: PA14 domain-containing protein [Verrucomicrobiota bacterium]
MRALLFPAILGLLVATTSAQDGGQLYNTYCSACHAPDGKGAVGGQFPPLAGSAWVAGKADRAIKVVLHGLEGPVDVLGKQYNLVMPPQGAALPDDHIAAILTYIRSSWGNNAGNVIPGQVKAIRDANAKRTAMWTQKELLKLHPLPKPVSVIENLISYQYEGKWGKLPDFTKLEPIGIEEEAHGFMLTSIAKNQDHFGLVWEGDFVIPRSGNVKFRLAADDGARVLINGEEVVKVDGIGGITGSRTKTGRVKLEGTKHKIRVEYFEASGQQGLQLHWSGVGVDLWQRLGDPSNKAQSAYPSIPIVVSDDRAAIYRNFIAGTTPRGIGVGLPGGINFAYSGDHLAPELMWTGKFMDGGRHWTNRGQGAEPPAGANLVQPTTRTAFPESAKFKGYRLDEKGNPTFLAKLDKLEVEDQFKTQSGWLVRTLRVSGEGSPVTIRIADSVAEIRIDGKTGNFQGRSHQLKGPAFFSLSDTFGIELLAPKFTSGDDGISITLAPGETATLAYQWK